MHKLLKKRFVVTLLCMSSLVLAVLTGTVLAAEDVDWWKKAAAPYKGRTITVLGEFTPVSEFIAESGAIREFEKVTGIKVNFPMATFEELFAKLMQDLGQGTKIYDGANFEQDIIFSFYKKGWLANLDKLMEEHPELIYPDLDLPDFNVSINYATFDGNLYGIPIECSIKTYVYRKDLFEDPEIKKAFKAEYGRDLAVPEDWHQYEQIAKFFTDWGKKKGIELYGHTAEAKAHIALAYELILEYFPPWGIWTWGINMDTMRASVEKGGTLNSPRAKEALQWYIDMLKYAPPGVRTYTWDEAFASMASGKVAQGLLYCEWFADMQMNPEKSVVVGKLDTDLTPTLPEVMNHVMRRKGYDEGYIGYIETNPLVVFEPSENKEPTFLLLQWLSRKSFMPEFVKATGNVLRKSSLSDPGVMELNEKLNGYFDLLTRYDFLYVGSPDFANHATLIQIYKNWFERAVAGEISVGDCLDGLAKEVDQVMEEMGY